MLCFLSVVCFVFYDKLAPTVDRIGREIPRPRIEIDRKTDLLLHV